MGKNKTTNRFKLNLAAAALLAFFAGNFRPGVELGFSFPGLPLALPTEPVERSDEVKASKKFKRQQRRARINKRGF